MKRVNTAPHEKLIIKSLERKMSRVYRLDGCLSKCFCISVLLCSVMLRFKQSISAMHFAFVMIIG